MKPFKQRHIWAVTSCREAQMRLTPVREAILDFLARRRTPSSLELISRADGVRGKCDSTTVYRTLMMFKEAEIVRVVGTPRKTSFFVLNAPGDNAHFLICRRCGSIVELPLPDALSAEIGQAASMRGFSPATDCEIHGLCKDCQSALKTQVTPSKLIVRIQPSTAKNH